MTQPIATRLAALDGITTNVLAESGATLKVALFVNGAEVVTSGYARQNVTTFNAAAAYASNRAARARSASVEFKNSDGTITFDQIKVYASDGTTLVDQSERATPRTNDGPVTIIFRSAADKLEFDCIDYDAAVDGATLDSTAWDNTLDAAGAYNGTARLPSGTSLIAADVLAVPSLTSLVGVGCEKSILKASSGATGAMVESTDLDDCITDQPKWSDGNGGALTLPPMRQRFQHIGFHGNGDNDDAPHENGASLDGSLTYVLNGLDIYSPGAVLEDLQFYKIEGTALRYNHGSIGTRPSPRPYADKESVWLRDIYVLNCLRGLWMQSGTDAVVDNVEVGGCRDEGILIDAGSGVWDKVHTYGNGVGVQCNNSTHFGILQVDADLVGIEVASTAAYTSIDKLLILNCFEHGAILTGSTEIGTLRIFNIPASAVGILFDANGGASISGGRCDVTGNAAVCFDVRAAHVDIRARVFGDASKTGGNAQTALKFGQGLACNGCNIELFVYGCNKGVDLVSIGYSNTITIRYRDCANPITSSILSMDASNTITLINTQDGTTEVWEP